MNNPKIDDLFVLMDTLVSKGYLHIYSEIGNAVDGLVTMSHPDSPVYAGISRLDGAVFWFVTAEEKSITWYETYAEAKAAAEYLAR